MTCFCDPRIDLRSRQLAAFSRLGTLCHFNLKLLGVHQIEARYSETTGCHLFDGTVQGIAVWKNFISGRIFSSLTCIAFPSQTVHGDCQCFMGLLADGTIGHSTGLETPYNRFYRLNFFQRNNLLREFEAEQPTQSTHLFALVIH